VIIDYFACCGKYCPAFPASTEAGVPRTLAEVASLSNVSYKEISKAYRQIVWNLDLKVPIVDPIKCIAKIANKMEIGENIKRHAVNYMHDLITSGIVAGKILWD
jgi:transcription initiation factor TFIIB